MDTSIPLNPSDRPYGQALTFVVCALLLFAGISGSLQAQPVGPDIRIADLIPSGLIDDSIRVGGAALAGSSIVAVWGTRRVLPDGEVVAALAIDGDSVEQQLFTPPEARPHHGVAVLSLGVNALVLWNDGRPNAAGVYAAVVDRWGRRVRPDTLLFSDREMSSPSYSFVAEEKTAIFITQIGEGEEFIDLLYVDSAGHLHQGPTRIREGKLDLSRNFPLRQGGEFLPVVGDRPLVILPDGSLYPYEIPEDRFFRPFVFDGPAGIVTTLPGDILVRYDSLHHDVPDWSVAGVSGQAIGRDSIGWFTAEYRNDYEFWSIQYMFFLERDYADILTGKLSRTLIDTVGGPGVSSSAFLHWLSEPSGYTLNVTGDGLMRLVARWTASYNPPGPLDEISSTVTVINDFYANVDRYVPREAVFTCSVSVSERKSEIAVNLKGTSRERRVQFERITPVAPDPASTYQPVLYAHSNSLVAGGIRKGDLLFSVRFPGADLSRPQPLPFYLNGDVHLDRYVRGWSISGYLQKLRETWSDVSWDPDRDHTTIEQYWWRLDTAGWKRETVAEFQSIGPWGFGDGPVPSAAYDPNRDTQVWFSQVTQGSSKFKPASRVKQKSLSNENDGVSISSDYVLTEGEILPVDSTSILHLANDHKFRTYGSGTRWNADGTTTPIGNVDLPRKYEAVGMQRLFGPKFLVSGFDREKEYLLLQLRGLRTELIQRRNLEATFEGAELPFVLQDQRDSSIILIESGPSGPVVSLLGPYLQEIKTSTGEILHRLRVSSGTNPSHDVVGALVNDTLFVAWTDERTGEPQAYMNAWVLPEDRYWERIREPAEEWHPTPDTSLTDNGMDTLSPEQRVDLYGFSIYGAWPNPAYRRVHLRIGSDVTRGIWVRQYDALGRLLGSALLDVLPGVHEYELPEVYSSSGLYYIELSDGEHRESVPVFVYRE